MQIVTVVTSVIYSIFQISGGLLLHPYQTMQHVVEEKVFAWLTFLPSVLALFSIGVWWVALKSLFLHLPYIGIWVFALIWVGLFFVFWQILLFYLLIRFWTTLGTKN